MLLSKDETRVISTIGWVDHGDLWVYEPDTGRVVTERVGEGGFLIIYPGAGGYFAAAHHRDNEGFLSASVRHTDAPAESLAVLRLDGGEPRLEGDPGAWASVPRAYYAGSAFDVTDAAAALFVAPDGLSAELQPLEWFNEDAFDLMYQGVLRPVEVPGRSEVLFPIQRDSSPVLYDPVARTVVGRVELAGEGGNPTLEFRRGGSELWADDYNTLLRLDPSDWSIRDQRRLQAEDNDGTRQFIGDWTFTADESRCLVARPFSGDAVALDTERFKVVARAALGRQPLQAIALSDGRVVARDWKSGEVLTGKLRRIRRVGLF
jgi:hypothetical protein